MKTTDIRDYPVAIIEDRYTGVYSGFRWIAIAEWTNERIDFVDKGINGDDCTAAAFRLPDYCVGGATPDEAIDNLSRRKRYVDD